MKASFLLFLFLLGLPACAVSRPLENKAPGQEGPRVTSGKSYFPHIVQKGQTLWRIARLYHISVEDILSVNKISDSGDIAAGRAILIPGSQAPIGGQAATEENGFIWPLQGRLLTRFRQTNAGVDSKGVDILAEGPGDVFCCRDGKVLFVGDLAGYGKTIILEHDAGIQTVYCGSSSVLVGIGEKVSQGRIIAKTGLLPRLGVNTVHFEVREKGRPRDPLYYLVNAEKPQR